MQSNEAVSVLKNLVYRPGWTFDAFALSEGTDLQKMRAAVELDTDDVDSIVLLRWENATVDTDRVYARLGYIQPKTLDQVVPLDASEFKDADQLLFAVFEMLMQLELHESREFFRCKDRDWNAPFHPHKDEGEALWAKCMNSNYETN